MKILLQRLHPDATLPQYQTPQSAGMDLAARLDEPVTIAPLERKVIPTGIAISLPTGFEAQVRARSGLSLKHGVTLANGIGTIDADYRGEIGVIMVNISQEPFIITPGMRIAQLVVARYENVTWDNVDTLDDTDRGEGGYGSTKH